MPMVSTPPAGFVFKQHDAPKVKPPVDYAAKFWNLVDKTEECWNWTGPTSTNHNTMECKKYEYGVFSVNGNPYSKLAHRCAVSIVFGTDLPDDWDVVPICDNRLCVNTEHLGIKIEGVLYMAEEICK